MNVAWFDVMAVDEENLVTFYRNSFERDTALGAWKRRQDVLSKWLVWTVIDSRFANMPLVRCEQELLFCCRLLGAIDARVDAEGSDPQLQCLFSGRLYTQ